MKLRYNEDYSSGFRWTRARQVAKGSLESPGLDVHSRRHLRVLSRLAVSQGDILVTIVPAVGRTVMVKIMVRESACKMRAFPLA